MLSPSRATNRDAARIDALAIAEVSDPRAEREPVARAPRRRATDPERGGQVDTAKIWHEFARLSGTSGISVRQRVVPAVVGR
jgi:hypothetical protein